MQKYSKKLLFNYINGNDIGNYDIDELEKDWEFIKEVVEFSNDKKMYNLCDVDLKSNYELMKYFVLKFKEDKEFTLQVAKDFLELSTDETNNLEMNIIITNIFENNYDEELSIYKLHSKVAYDGLRIKCDVALAESEQIVKDYYQMGFELLTEQVYERKIIIDYIARNMVDEIFAEEQIALEELIHNKFKSKDDLEKIGITNFIINYISTYDSNLSSYLRTNMDILKNIKEKIEKIYLNFDKYNKQRKKEIKNWIEDYLIDYSLDTGYLSGTQLIKFIAKDLDIKELMVQQDEFDEYDEEDYLNAQTDIEYIKLKKNIFEVLKTFKIPDEYLKQKEETDKCKILSFRRRKKVDDN